MAGPSGLKPRVLAAREKISQAREKLHERHNQGSPGVQICAAMTDLLDSTLLDLYDGALQQLTENIDEREALQSQLALVPHGGYGRRDMAPYSDVDLMLLYDPQAIDHITPLAQCFTQDIYDSGLKLGFSARSSEEACKLAMQDISTFTSLAESRFLHGSVQLYSRYNNRFRRATRRYRNSLIERIIKERQQERQQFGDTVFLLKPNIKRSRGSLRDLQLVRWIGFTRYGEADLDSLRRLGALTREDRKTLRKAHDFLLQLRNEMHFHAGNSQDLLTREEQVRLAEKYDYASDDNLLGVERFMQVYFEQTSQVRYATTHFVNSARSRRSWGKFLGPLVSHQVEGDFQVGPFQIRATRRGLEKVRNELSEVLRLMDLANLYDKRIDHSTWQAIRESMLKQPQTEISPEASRRFLSLLAEPARLAGLLRRLHELRVLECFIPAIRKARCLLQFNEYHKYTVDEHTIRAVYHATEFLRHDGPLGDAYRSLEHKRTLHLALLLHDLGKGTAEDHCEVGLRIARKTAAHLQLPPEETETICFLVHKHLTMSNLALRHDLNDPDIVLQFAVEVGSPEVLQMLYLLTCADISAVGPGVFNNWKLDLLTELYLLARNHLTGDSTLPGSALTLEQRRTQLRQQATVDEKERDKFNALVNSVPAGYLSSVPGEQVLPQLQALLGLQQGKALAWARFVPERNAVEYTIGSHESTMAGMFHRLTGVLSSQRNQILAAEIDRLTDDLVVDRFYTQDLDFTDQPSQERLDEISAKLLAAIESPQAEAVTFRKVWQSTSSRHSGDFNPMPTRIAIDNNTAGAFTIVNIFAYDKMGLLYSITRCLYDLKLEVHLAKITTHVDQVVDVFYVTDREGKKIESSDQLKKIREQLLAAIKEME